MNKAPDDEPQHTPLVQWWRGFIVAPLRRANDDTRVYLESPAGRGVDRKTIAVLLIAALALTLHWYQCRVDQMVWVPWLLAHFGQAGAAASVQNWLDGVQASEIDRWTFWALAGFVSYGIVPALVLRFVFRERLADYGLKLRGAFADSWVYLLMLVFMAPLVWAMSFNPHFQKTYPFYEHPAGAPLWPDFWRWEAAYGLQFLGVEFFFRGYLLHGLRRRFGAYAIVVMTVPYCMIHFGKPLPETLASIPAGLALGFMSLRTRSIVLGVAIHITVAMSMDFASMWQKGWFG
jgi:membrane protease YdiL (CAAX protease family)